MTGISKIALMAIVSTFAVKAATDVESGPEIGQVPSPIEASPDASIGGSGSSTPSYNDAEEEARRQEDAKRAVEEEAQRTAAAAAETQRLAEETALLEKEAAEKAKAAEESERQAAEEDARRIAEEAEKAQRAAEKAAEEEKIAAEAARRGEEEKAQRAAEEAERQRLVAEQAAKKAQKIKRTWNKFKANLLNSHRIQKAEAARLEEARRAAEEEARRQEDAKRAAEEARRQVIRNAKNDIKSQNAAQQDGLDALSDAGSFINSVDERNAKLDDMRRKKVARIQSDITRVDEHKDAKGDFERGMAAYNAKPLDNAVRLQNVLKARSLVSDTETGISYFKLENGKYVDPHTLGRIDAALDQFKNANFKEFEDARKVIADYKDKIKSIENSAKKGSRIVDTWRKFKDTSVKKNQDAVESFWGDVDSSSRRERDRSMPGGR